MLAEPQCWIRKCKHFIGVIQPDGTEMIEINACNAYSEGIPNDIAYGKDKHFKPRLDQKNEIIYEKK